MVWAFNPAVWYVSSWWGQIGALYILPMWLGVAAAVKERWWWAGWWLAVSILVKPMGVVVAPVIGLWAWRRGIGWAVGVRRWGEIVVGGLVVMGVVLWPWWAVGQLGLMVKRVRALAGNQLFLTMNAHNGWFAVSGGRGSFAARMEGAWLDNEPLLLGLTGWTIGLGLLVGWSVVVMYFIWKRESDEAWQAWWGAAALVFGFFMLPTEAHERYLLPVLALSLPLLPLGRVWWWWYGLVSATLFLNLWWVDAAISMAWFERQLGWGTAISWVNVGLFLFLGKEIASLWGRVTIQTVTSKE
ncbi:MAG TPA: hypothetical protein VLL52_21965, partial [Anaerolineae bacterium]|nr:hypothetical protein [Anaerolineae bacterium]